jgi:hypothetical protein
MRLEMLNQTASIPKNKSDNTSCTQRRHGRAGPQIRGDTGSTPLGSERLRGYSSHRALQVAGADIFKFRLE